MAGAGVKKKAKLAHEKRGQQPKMYSGDSFAPKKIVSEVVWPKDTPAIIADLDGNGRLGIIPRLFAMKDRQTGDWIPSNLACPAVYDAVAAQNAEKMYQDYVSQTQS